MDETRSPDQDDGDELDRLRARVAQLEAEVEVLRKIVLYLGDRLRNE